MAVAGPDYRILSYNIGAPGSFADSTIFTAGGMFNSMKNNTCSGPPAEPLPGMNKLIPYSFIGDDAFALSTCMMKGYPYQSATTRQAYFNKRLSRARRVVENVFGHLVQRFGVFQTSMKVNPNKASIITEACVLLHNLLLKDSIYNKNMTSKGTRKKAACLDPWQPDDSISTTIPSAKDIREELNTYINRD